MTSTVYKTLCDRCNGKGHIEYWLWSGGNTADVPTDVRQACFEPCQACGGTGYIYTTFPLEWTEGGGDDIPKKIKFDVPFDKNEKIEFEKKVLWFWMKRETVINLMWLIGLGLYCGILLGIYLTCF